MISHPQPTRQIPPALFKAPIYPDPTLWSQLEPQQQKRLAQHWAQLIRQILKTTAPLKETEDDQA